MCDDCSSNSSISYKQRIMIVIIIMIRNGRLWFEKAIDWLHAFAHCKGT